MQPNRLGRDLSILFAVVLLLYILAYSGLEHARSRRGSWQVTFQKNAEGQPVFSVSQPYLGIQRFELVFPEEKWTGTNAQTALEFNGPRETPFEIPFGRVIYEDLTFLPGAVTFDLFEHEVELLPRTLILNRHEQPWQSSATIQLWSTNKVKEIRLPKHK